MKDENGDITWDSGGIGECMLDNEFFVPETTKFIEFCPSGFDGRFFMHIYEVEPSKEVDESEKTYLYKEGNEYEELTGGWEVGFLNGTNASVGSAEKKENCIDVKTWGYWCGYGCRIKNMVDVTKYTKLRVDVYDCSWEDRGSGGYEQLEITCNGKQKIESRDNLRDRSYMLDIRDLTGNANISIQIGNGANGKIRAIWLEK